MSAQVSSHDMEVRLVRPSDNSSEINYVFNRKRPVFTYW